MSSGLYLYAVLGDRPASSPGRGLGDEPLEILAGPGLHVAVGHLAAPPLTEVAVLRAHDAVVRRLAGTSDAILPMRFGSWVADEARLWAALEGRVAALGEALAAVRGREQMIVRVFGAGQAGNAPPTPGRATAVAGPGTRFLQDRLERERAVRETPELQAVRCAVAAMVEAERLEIHRRPPALASLYHLVRRGRGPAYRAAIARRPASAAGVRLTVSGPWPPYAFAPEALP
jgi:hypothetical protein